MIDIVKRFFNKIEESPASSPDVSAHDIRVATCALLLEMAHIDGEFSDTEKNHIIQQFKKNEQLSEDYIEELMRIAAKELDESVDLWRFTNLINQNYALEEKLRIIEMIWRLVYTDGKLDKHEDYLMHKLANLLRLNHKQLIDAKLKVTRST